MIDSVHVTEPKLNIDFRIDGLKKFNVIFGPNGSGKSLILPHIGRPMLWWFEDEKALNGKSDILYWMRRHFPFIKDYKVSYRQLTEDSYSRHIMYIKYIGFKKWFDRSTLSSGPSRILSMLVELVNNRNGYVLIDDVEHGIYYERYHDLWVMLIEMSYRYDVQMFLTTHSKEFLEAGAELFKGHADDFLFIRMEPTGKRAMRQYVPRKLSAQIVARVLESGLEIRGCER